ncbi:MAG TPA: metal ABC transporter permease [Verrucomicrobia bacterium]|nr:metal ABC transporter permease [Verrucomicrobiota bacterium]HOP96619.1 metal ABC transporter permease [Verrucomicrobiota bacterium]
MSLVPPFDLHNVFVAPWADDFGGTVWVVIMGFLVTLACGLVGNYLILRRMALVGDAISHSVLPGIAIAFLLSNSRGTTAMFAGALAAGVLTTLIIELIHKKSRVKQDAAIGIAFTSLFAIGVILISVFASRVDLDQECVLYGEIGFVSFQRPIQLGAWTLGPEPVIRMAGVTLMVILLIAVFYKELLVSSFDPGLAFSLGINATVMHYSLMCVLSTVVVSAFESVGAILVIAMLILPGATGSMLFQRLPGILVFTALYAALTSVAGFHLATWLNCSIAGAMVVAGAGLFTLAWLVSPHQGPFRRARPLPDANPRSLREDLVKALQ